MSKAFEQALYGHLALPVNWREFRGIWHPNWKAICVNEAQFLPNVNIPVPAHIAVSIMVYNSALAREVLGLVGHNQLTAIATEAMNKFNKKATNQDMMANKVQSALIDALNKGQYR